MAAKQVDANPNRLYAVKNRNVISCVISITHPPPALARNSRTNTRDAGAQRERLEYMKNYSSREIGIHEEYIIERDVEHLINTVTIASGSPEPPLTEQVPRQRSCPHERRYNEVRIGIHLRRVHDSLL